MGGGVLSKHGYYMCRLFKMFILNYCLKCSCALLCHVFALEIGTGYYILKITYIPCAISVGTYCLVWYTLHSLTWLTAYSRSHFWDVQAKARDLWQEFPKVAHGAIASRHFKLLQATSYRSLLQSDFTSLQWSHSQLSHNSALIIKPVSSCAEPPQTLSFLLLEAKPCQCGAPPTDIW